QTPGNSRRALKRGVVPSNNVPAQFDILLGDGQRDQFEREVLPNHIHSARWFGSKARSVRNVKVTEQLPVSPNADGARLWLVEVNYLDAPSETYTIPVEIAS